MSWVATAIVGGAVVGAAATYYSSKKASEAAKKAAAMQSDALVASTAMQLDYLRETREDLAKAVEEGVMDLETAFKLAIEELTPEGGFDAITQYARLLEHPEMVMENPATQYQYRQGLEALQAGFSRRVGGGLSGRVIKAAEEYGQNFAAAALDRELSRLGTLITNQTNLANLYKERGTALANLKVGGEAKVAGLTGQMVPSIAAGIQQQGQVAASNVIAQSNIQTNAAQNYANLANQAALTYALYRSGAFNTTKG